MYSYDIFDTVIWRTTPRSTSIFEVMESDERFYAYWTYASASFSKVRKNTEFIMRRIIGGGIGIQDIYSKIGKKYAIDQAKINALINLELLTERRCWVLNPVILSEIKGHIQKGEKVVLISDMYWSSEQIRSNLVMLDGVFAQIPIYVSCEWNATKANGKLYQIVKEQESVEFADWKHIGDNKQSDYCVPKHLGIEAICIRPGTRYSYEKQLDIQEKGILSTYEAIVKTRTHSNGDAFDLGASFAAPMVYQYVNWCIEQSLQHGIKKLFFVLRDGYILKRVADIIIEQRGLSINTEDLYGSRVAWRRPEITVEKLKKLSVWDKSNWIFRDPCYAFVAFERLGFSKNELSIYLPEKSVNKELQSFKDFKTILDELLNNLSFCVALEQKTKEAGENLIAYFRSVLVDCESFAFVDTNSTGKTQADLSVLLKREAPDLPNIRFFYHTFLGNQEEINAEDQFVFQVAEDQDRRFPEALFRAPYNPCYGFYRDKENAVIPTFFQSDYCAWNGSFDYDSYLSGILEFTRKIEDEQKRNTVQLDAFVEYLLKVANFGLASKDVISQVGELPFSPDVYGNETIDFYPKLSFDVLIHPFSQLIYFPKGSFYCKGGLWIYIYKFLFSAVKILRRIRKNR